MSKRSQTLRALVTERLNAAAEEIFELVERTILEYEEELCRSKEENRRRQEVLEEALKLRRVHATGETVPGVKQEQLDGSQVHRAPPVKVKEENPDQLPIPLPREEPDEEPGEPSEPQWELQTAEEPQWELQTAEEPQWELQTAEEPQWELLTAEEPRWELQTSEPQWELLMDKYVNVNAYFSDNNDMEEDVQDWTVPLNEEEDDNDGATPETQTQTQTQGKTLVCSFCQMTFARLCLLKRHMTLHGCSICKKICPDEESLRVHMLLHTEKGKKRKKNSDERPFICHVCKMAFKGSLTLSQHMYQHTGKRPFQCSRCDDSFKRKWELDQHMAKHGIPYRPKVSKKRYKWP